MKIILAAVAALVAFVSVPAAAAPAPVAAPVAASPAPFAAPQDRRVVVRERTTVTRRNWNRPRYRTRNVCRTTVRYGERRRVCRRVRYRY